MPSLIRPRHAIGRSWPPAPLLVAAGLIALIAAQSSLQSRELTAGGAVALASGLAMIALSLVVAPPGPVAADPAYVGGSVRRWPLVLAFALALVAWFVTGGNEYTRLGVATWLAAVAAWCWAWWPPRAPGARARGFPRTPTREQLSWLVPLALALIVALGVFLRFHALGDVPLDPTSDHAEKLLDVNDLLAGERPIFFERNTGREPGQFYVTYALMKVFGLSLSFQTLKIGTALVGVLVIPAVFLFAYELAGRNTALAAAALTAIGKWPLTVDRIGLRFAYASLATAVTLWLLLRYLRTGDRRCALACGLAVGIGLQGYTPYRIVPIAIALVLILAATLPALSGRIARRAGWRLRPRRIVADGALVFGTAFLTCLPLVRYTAGHFDAVFARARSRADSELGLAGTVGQVAENTWNAALAYNWRGGDAWFNGVPFDPLLEVVTGGALLAGLVILLYRVGRLDLPAVALAIMLPILMLPSILSISFPLENPAPNRLATALPAIFTVAALPFGRLWDSIGPTPRFRQGLTAIAAGLTLAALTVALQLNFDRYFHDYRREYDLRAPTTHEIVAAVRATGVDVDDTYIVGFPDWVDTRNVGFGLGRPTWWEAHALPPGGPLPQRRSGHPLLVIVYGVDVAYRARLGAAFPYGSETVAHSRIPGKDFVLFTVAG